MVWGLLLLGLVACSSEPERRAGQAPDAELPEALQVFDAFVDVFDRDYALFAERLPHHDWRTLTDAVREDLGPDTTDDALYDAMIGLVRELDDGHSGIIARDLGRNEDGQTTLYPHAEVMESVELDVERHYLSRDLRWAARDWVAWGRIPRAGGDVGYLSLTSMDGLSPSGAPRPDVDAALSAVDRAFADLSDVDGLVVDVRANEGGWDDVSLAIAQRFAGDRTLCWWKQERDGPEHDDFTPWREVHVEAGDAWDKPTVLLTSGMTFSAAETFVLAMSVRDQITVLGERTSGHFSDIGARKLPNGWGVRLSPERYRAADGEIYEARGAPVHVEVPFDPAALDLGRDVMLEAAVQRL